MVWCTHFVSKLEVHIISNVVMHKILLTLNSFENHIWLIWALKVKKIIQTMNMQLIHTFTFM